MDSVIVAGTLASLLAGLATTLGALPILVMGKPSDQQQNLLLGFAAGVMLAASFFSLILPAIEVARDQGSSPLVASSSTMTRGFTARARAISMRCFSPPLKLLPFSPSISE